MGGWGPRSASRKWEAQVIGELTDLKSGCLQLVTEFGNDEEENEANEDTITMQDIDNTNTCLYLYFLAFVLLLTIL